AARRGLLMDDRGSKPLGPSFISERLHPCLRSVVLPSGLARAYPSFSMTPEQSARKEIDANLKAAGWVIQDRLDVDLTAGRGIAVREFPMKPGFGFADYLLYVDRKAAGAVEAKAHGTLTGVEAQSAKYAAGLPDNLPAHRRPLPLLFESNGPVTFLTNGLDPVSR